MRGNGGDADFAPEMTPFAPENMPFAPENGPHSPIPILASKGITPTPTPRGMAPRGMAPLRASMADWYKQVLPVPYACASTATSLDGVSWCILEAWEGRVAVVLENLIVVRISTTSKHRWQPSARARPRLSWQSKII